MTNLNNPLIILSDNTDDYFHNFIESSIKGFYLELGKMMQDNDATNFHTWFTERSYLSLFFNAVIRNDKENKKTVIQEYSVLSTNTNDRGRCDGLMCDDKKVVLFEAKAFSKDEGIRNDHFDVQPWLEWDEKIREQLMWYYEQDKDFFMDKKRYKHCYLATIVFKVIMQFPKIFTLEAQNKLKSDDINSVRPWYYSVAFLNSSESDEKFYGIEVYGTVQKIEEEYLSSNSPS